MYQGTVHGKFFGSLNRVAPAETKSCGTFLPLRYFWLARLVGVPSVPASASTPRSSTSLRLASTALGGEKPLSSETSSTLRPLMPPCAFNILKYATCTRPTTLKAEAGPL